MNKTAFRGRFVSILIILLFAFIIAVFIYNKNPLMAEANVITTDNYKIRSSTSIEDEYSEDNVIIVLQETHSQYSGISSDLLTKLENVGIAAVSELTALPYEYITGNGLIDENAAPSLAQYYNENPFHQILKATLKESGKEKVLNIISVIDNFPEVLYVGPDMIVNSDALSNDAYLALQWSVTGTNNIDLINAWNLTTGNSDIRVGVIDSGIANHSDLNVNVVEGYDFYNNNSITSDVDGGHGTHVAGIIGAVANNGIGVTGVSPNVSLVPLQTAYDTSGSGTHHISELIEAINYATNKWGTQEQISVLNYSISGFGTSLSIALAARNFPGLFVWSAGNNNQNVDMLADIEQFKADNIISVGNLLSNDTRASSSSYGKYVSIYAPGGNILSTYPSELCALGNCNSNHYSNGYHYMSGTSMAAPHVTGVAALLLSLDPTLTGSELKSIIINSADNIKIDKGVVKKLNAYEAVKQVGYTTDIFNTTILSDDEIKIDGLNVNYEGVLRIPTIIANRKVTQINSEAFSQQERITEIVIPSTVESIGNAAFFNCSGLKKVTFEGYSNLNYINGYAFQQCYNLESLTIPSTVTNVSSGILSFGERLTVYTDLDRDPSTWDNYWNYSDWISIERPVIWGCELSADKSYVVSFTKTSASITKPNAVNGISAPSREGYVFGGWYKNDDFTGTAIAAENIATAENNVTYYAKWIPDCDVVFDFDGGASTNYVISIPNGVKIDEPIEQPNKAGYVFKYWALSTNLNQEYNWNTEITNNIVIEAVWQEIGNNYVVTFDLNGGVGAFNTQVLVANGSTVSRPTSPSKVGYTFAGWAPEGQASYYNFSTPVTSDITLVAVWRTTQICTITFNLNGGYGDFPDITINRLEKIEEPSAKPAKAGNHFKYWALSTDLTKEYNWNNLVSENITLIAVWENFNRVVSFNSNGGTAAPGTIILNVGDCVSDFEKMLNENQPERTGYTFEFWATSPTSNVAYNLDLPVTNNLTLYAIWRINTYTVSFNLDGGSGSFPNKTINYGSTVSKPAATPTKDGFTFKYWALSGQTTEYNFSTPVTSDITLVAIWEQDSCVAEGTLITLADGSQVPVENLTGGEMLLVWNLYTGSFDIAPILVIDSDALKQYEVIKLTFSDGTTVDVISEHGFFDVDLNKYVYLDKYAEEYIGHRFLKQNENGMVQVTLVDVAITLENVAAYSPVTYGHLCYYVNGMLSIPGGINGLFNIFEVDAETMKFDAEAMEADVEMYGLYTYEELNSLVRMQEIMFDAVNGQYLKVAIGKGIITIEQISELVERYGGLFEQVAA